MICTIEDVNKDVMEMVENIKILNVNGWAVDGVNVKKINDNEYELIAHKSSIGDLISVLLTKGWEVLPLGIVKDVDTVEYDINQYKEIICVITSHIEEGIKLSVKK